MSKRVLKVEASAGSGKTYRLTLEYLSKLFSSFLPLWKKHQQNQFISNSGEQKRRIIGSLLAITFTIKAANEMKERVITRLKKFSRAENIKNLSDLDKEFLDSLSKRTNIPQNQILKISNFVLNSIIEYYSDFNIKTIDSLMNSVVTVISPDLDLTADYETGVNMAEEQRILIKEFISELTNTKWEQVVKFLEDFKNTYNVEKWNLDEDICDRIVELYDRALNQESNLLYIDDLYLKELKNNIKNGLIHFRQMLKVLKDNFISEAGSSYIHGSRINRYVLEEIDIIINNKSSFPNIKVVESLLGKSLFNYNHAEGLCKKDSPRDFLAALDQVWTKVRISLSVLLESLSRFRVIHYQRFFLDFFDFWKKNQKNIYISEFSKKIKEVFEKWGEVLPYIYLKLSDRYHHFLIDEFQDTSKLQFKALMPIVREVLSSLEDSSLFVVGDRKQAIYRWRGGDTDLLNEDIFLANSETLRFNFRSGKEIIEFNNAFWDPKNIGQVVDYEPFRDIIRDNFKDAGQKVPNLGVIQKGYVNIRIRKLKKDEDSSIEYRLDLIFREIRQFSQKAIQNGFLPGEIAILIRKKETGRQIIKYLTAMNIPAMSDESLFVSSSPLINEVVSFFKFLEYPPDNLNFYTFIVGEIFSRQASKIQGRDFKWNDTDFLQLDEKNYYKRFKKKYPDLWTRLIKPFFNVVGFLPAYDIFQDVTSKFKLYEEFNGSAPFFLTFSNLLHHLEEKGLGSISAFIDDWERRIESGNEYSIDIAEDMKRIKVLTIHKAKGLEFPVVIVPLIKSDEMGENYFFDKDHVYYIKKDYIKISEKLSRLYQLELGKNYLDNLNLLYVAFTRASQMLGIPLVIKYKQEKSNKSEDKSNIKRFTGFENIIAKHPLMKDLITKSDGWSDVEYGTSNIRKHKRSAISGRISTIQSKKIITAEWQKDFLVFNSNILLKESEKKAVKRGEIIHRVLEKIDKIESPDKVLQIIEGYAEQETELTNEDKLTLIRFLSMKNVFPFFNGDFKVYNEKSLVSFIEGGYQFFRIDRLLVSDKECIVVDFKTGNKKSEDIIQIKNYIAALKDIYENLTPKAYILYIDELEVLEVKC